MWLFRKVICQFLLKKSKTDIYRDGQWVVIARTNSRLCPVKNLEMFLDGVDLLKAVQISFSVT